MDVIKKYYGVFLFILGIMLFIAFTRSCDRNPKWIIESEVSGRIAKISQSRLTVTFKLENNDSTTYDITPFINIDYTPQGIAQFAVKGDSLFKAAGSDSIYIIRDGKRYGWWMPWKRPSE